MFDKKRY